MNFFEDLMPYAPTLGSLLLIYFIGFFVMLFRNNKERNKIKKLRCTLSHTTQQYALLQLDLHEANFMLFTDTESEDVPFALRLQEHHPNIYRMHKQISEMLMRNQHNTE